MIDIIIPYYRTDLYPRCIKSIEDHTEPGTYQIYLVNDTQGKRGPIKAYNHGMRNTQNDVVLLNDDIVVTDNWLINMRSVNADVVLSIYHNEAFYPNISCTLVKRAVMERVGLLDERWYLGFGADNLWFARIEQAGFRIDVNRKNHIHHIHRASIRKVLNYRQIAEREQKMFLESQK